MKGRFERRAVLLCRFAGFVFVCLGLLGCAAGIVNGLGRLDRVYWDLFLRDRVLMGVLVEGFGLVLWLGGGVLGRLLARDLDSDEV